MSYFIEILRDLGTYVTVETSTAEALRPLSGDTYHMVISDMERDRVPDEGIRFLKRIRQNGVLIPVTFTVGRFNPALGTPAFAFGRINSVNECLDLVFDALKRVRG